MANEILALEGDGDRAYTLLFLFPIAAPVQVTPPGGSAQNVVPTPSATLPPLAALLLSAAEKNALDAGTLAWQLTTFAPEAGLTGGPLVARVRELYAAQRTAYQAAYQARYRYIGQRVTPT